MRCYDSRHTVAVLRKIAGLSQGELAAMVGRSKRTIQAIEIGRLKLSEDLAVKIAHETGVTVQWLLEGDYNTPPRVAFSDSPFSRKIFEDTQAAITAGKNPNPLAINLSNEGDISLELAPVAMMAKLVEQTNSLLHPQIDYWLAAILSSIFAAAKAGQARLAIYRLAEFSKAMKKEFSQRFDGEFTSDAAVVFEQGLERVKMTEILVKKGKHGVTPSPRSSVGKQEPSRKDLLDSTQLALGLQGLDAEALWAELNNVGDRIKARHFAAQESYEAFDGQLKAVLRAAKSGGRKPNPPAASKISVQEPITSEMPSCKPMKRH